MGSGDTGRKRILADAAFQIVGDAGLRALTHRAVDVAAGLPSGTCSYHFPARRALLAAVLDRIADLDHADLETLIAGRTVAEMNATTLIEGGTALLAHWLGPARARSRARMLLMLDPQSRELTEPTAAAVTASFRTLATTVFGDADRGGLLMALVDGLLVDELTHGQVPVDTTRLRARFSAVVGLALQQR